MTRPPGTTRRRPRWAVISGILLAKVLIIAGIVLLPSGLAISLGAAHGIVLLVVGGSAAVALLVARRRGGSARSPSPHGAHHGPGSLFALGSRLMTKISKKGTAE